MFRSYHGRIDGWVTEWELYFLYSNATLFYNYGPILEVGSWQGLSTSALMQVGCPLDCVDTWEGSTDMGGGMQELIMRTMDKPLVDVFLDNMGMVGKECPGATIPQMWQMKSEDFWQKRAGEKEEYRLIFIDGDHRYDTARNDFENAKRLIHPGGIIVFDDITWADVNRAATDTFEAWRALDGKFGVWGKPTDVYGRHQ